MKQGSYFSTIFVAHNYQQRENEGHISSIVTGPRARARSTDRVEVSPDDTPHVTPFKTDAPHVVVGNFDDLLQGEHARVLGATQLFIAHGTQCFHKVN